MNSRRDFLRNAMLLSGGLMLGRYGLGPSRAAELVSSTGSASKAETASWFQAARFGMFIHWGIYSAPGKGEWMLHEESIYNDGTPAGLERYRSLAAQFTPQPEAIAQLVSLAKAAGMKYITLVSRHHDGFNLWDTKADAYSAAFNSVKLGSRFDIVAAFAAECRKQGLRLGLYYSILDWAHPDFPVGHFSRPRLKLYAGQRGDWEKYRAFMQAQFTELLTNYGPILDMWFDGHWSRLFKSQWKMDELYHHIHQVAPTTLIANNKGMDNPAELLPGEDILVMERDTKSVAAALRERCDTTQIGAWGYQTDAKIQSRAWIADTLIRNAAEGNNLLLNIGPRADGSLPDELVQNLQAVGEWLNINGEAIYGSREGLGESYPDSTRKTAGDGQEVVYLFVKDKADQIELAKLPSNIVSVTLLADLNHSLPAHKSTDTGAWSIDASSLARAELPHVLKIKFGRVGGAAYRCNPPSRGVTVGCPRIESGVHPPSLCALGVLRGRELFSDPP
jgi:alpha-L-fucosidase